MKKEKTKRIILTLLLSLVCAFAVAGATFVIYNHIADRNAANEYSDDDEWTKNY